MSKLSPAYREDSADQLDPAVEHYLDREYLRRQLYIDQHNPDKVVILFAGGSGVGKSSLARAIQAEFKGLILENDGIKRVLQAYDEAELPSDLSPTTWKYTFGLYARLARLTENGFVIRDGMIHWYFDRLLPVFEKAGYRPIVIHYNISREKNTQLIVARGDTDTTSANSLLTLLDDQDIHMKRFLQAYTPEIVIDESNLYDYERVINELRAILAS